MDREDDIAFGLGMAFFLFLAFAPIVCNIECHVESRPTSDAAADFNVEKP